MRDFDEIDKKAHSGNLEGKVAVHPDLWGNDR